MPSITDWLMVGITFVYVIATIFICVFNGKAAKAAKEQTDESRRQFFESNRPNVIASLEYINRTFWALRFTNCGSQTAFNFSFELSESFLNSIKDERFRNLITQNKGKACTLGIGQHYDLYFGDQQYLRNESKVNASGRMRYRANQSSLYVEDFDIDIKNYLTFFSVDSESDKLRKTIDDQRKVIERQNQLIQNQVSTLNRIADELHSMNHHDSDAEEYEDSI